MLEHKVAIDRLILDGQPAAVGITLHSGDIFLGSIGHTEYARPDIIGDTVNTASRIEGLTMTLGGPILLSESTRAALLRRPSDLRPVGEVEIRGRQSAVSLWTVDGAPGSPQERPAGP